MMHAASVLSILVYSALGGDPFFVALKEKPGDSGMPVMGRKEAAPFSIKGFEGSFYTKTSKDGLYHYLSAGRLPQRKPGIPDDIMMRFDHWTSRDGRTWAHSSSIYNSSGTFDGTDRKASTWAPMATFDQPNQTWHLFLVGYRANPDYRIPLYNGYKMHAYQQFDGQIWHYASQTVGEEGIGGPYTVVGPILDQETLGGFDSTLDAWEGDHGCDMFFPFQLPNGSWVGFYGSELGRFPHFNTHRQIGLAASVNGQLTGPWERLHRYNPLHFRPPQPGLENPVVIKTTDGKFYIAVYHVFTGASVGISWSRDGIHWVNQNGDVRLSQNCTDVSTACGLVAEPTRGKGVYSLLYTGTHSGFESVCRAYLVNMGEQQ